MSHELKAVDTGTKHRPPSHFSPNGREIIAVIAEFDPPLPVGQTPHSVIRRASAMLLRRERTEGGRTTRDESAQTTMNLVWRTGRAGEREERDLVLIRHDRDLGVPEATAWADIEDRMAVLAMAADAMFPIPEAGVGALEIAETVLAREGYARIPLPESLVVRPQNFEGGLQGV